MSNAKVRYFDLGDILSITTDRLVSPRHIEGVYDICDFLTGDKNFTHQLGRASQECKPWVFEQHPKLSEISGDGVNSTNWREWMELNYQKYGREFALTPMPRERHTHINPLEELSAMVGEKKVIVVAPEETL